MEECINEDGKKKEKEKKKEEKKTLSVHMLSIDGDP